MYPMRPCILDVEEFDKIYIFGLKIIILSTAGAKWERNVLCENYSPKFFNLLYKHFFTLTVDKKVVE